MVVDGFIFFNELDLLDIRLHTMCDSIDVFVLVESPVTHSGKRKRLFYDENKSAFSKFNIEHVICNDLIHSNPWANETAQRNAIDTGFKRIGVNPDDIVLVSDVDEIICNEAVRHADAYIHYADIIAFEQKMFYYYLNNHAVSMGWAGTKGVRYKNFTTAQELRQARAGKTLSGAGWHFSYIGGEQRIADKLAAFSHQELKGFNNHENITKTLRENKDLFNRNEQFNVIEIDDTFPKYIRENQDKFGHLIK